MDAEFRLRARTLDPVVIGGRVREARIRAGLTQAEAAGDDISPAYISRIESGDRRPGADLLGRLATTLGTTLDALLAPDTDSTADYDTAVRARVALDLAGLDLEVERPEPARVEAALDTATRLAKDLDAPGQLRREARLLRARALAARSELNAAISALEELLADEPPGLRRWEALQLLGRCHRTTGDLARATDLAREAVALVEQLGLVRTPEGVRAAHALLGVLVEQGDLAQAVLLGRAALEGMAGAGPRQVAAAYRDAADRLAAADALHEAAPLAERAVDALRTGEGRVELSRLQTALALACLRLDGAQRDELGRASGAPAGELELGRLVEQVLGDATGLLDEPWAEPRDLAELGLARAHARLAAGELAEARTLAETAAEHAATADDALVRARAAVLLGHVAQSEGQPERALGHFAHAAECLGFLGDDRRAGEVWLELASTYEELDRLAEALGAYRAAASAAGLPPRRVLDSSPAPSRA